MAKEVIDAEPIESRDRRREVLENFSGVLGSWRALLAMYRDPAYRFPMALKAMTAFVVVYLLSPIDIIPEGFLLLLGLTDDLAILTAWLMLLNAEIRRYVERIRGGN